MPGNDIPEIVHNFFNHDNSSQNQSQFGDRNWSVLNNNQQAGFQRQTGAQPSLHINNHTSQTHDSNHGNGMQPAQSFYMSNPSSKEDLVLNQPTNQHLIMNGYMHNSQGSSLSTGQRLIHRNISPYERPESTEAPVNFDFLGSQHQLVRGQHHGNPQPFQIQTQRINDMQLWQQQMMQQQLLLHMQQGRQLNTNQIQSAFGGMPINAVSNKVNNVRSNEDMNMNWVQRSTMQGMIPNGFMFSHDQNQSLNGGGVATSMGDTLNHQSRFQETQDIPHDFASAINQNQQVGITEQKLLFSAGGKENPETCSNIQHNLIQIDEHDSFPTMNSGSWSALMQDAVEASSSDAGINEKWSGLKLPSVPSNMQSLTSTLPLFSDADTISNFNQPMKFTSQQNEAAIYMTFDQQKQQRQLNNISNDGLVPQEQSHLHRQSRNNINGLSHAQSVESTASRSFNYLENNGKKQHNQIHDTERSMNVRSQQTQESRHMAFSRNQVNYEKTAPAAQFLQTRKEETTSKYKDEPSSFGYNDLTPGWNQCRNDTQMLVNSNNMGQKDVGLHMFHYHPMGNIGISNEPMGPAQSAVKLQDQRYVRQPHFLGRSWNNGSDSEKGHLSDLPKNKNAAGELQYGGSDQLTSDCSQSLQAGSTSQNMLELLDKVNQSAIVKPVEPNTQVGESNLDSSSRLSSHIQPHQSPSYQEFGLKLAPPSQRQSFTDHFLSPQTPLHIGNGFIPRNADSGVNIKPSSYDTSLKEENQGDMTFLTGQKSKEVVHSNIQMTKQQLQWKQSQQQYQHPQHQPQQQQHKTPQQQHQQHKIPQQQLQHNTPQQHLQQQHQQHQLQQQQKQQQHEHQHQKHQQQQQKQNFGSQQEMQSRQSSSVDTSNSQPKNTNIGLNKPETRAVRPSVTSAVSQKGGVSKMLHNVWTNISSEQHTTGFPPQKFISNMFQKPDNNLNKRKVEDSTSSPQLSATENQSVKDDPSKQMPPPISVEMSTVEKQRNNNSFFQQAHPLKNVEPDPTERVDNRLKGVDFSTNTSHMGRAQGQRYIFGQNTVLRETETVHKPSFSTDANISKLSSSDSKDSTTNTSHDRLKPPFFQNQSLPNISPQMAPLWFEKYGNCSNNIPKEVYYAKIEKVSGQEHVLPMISERKVNCVETDEKDKSNNSTVSSPSHLVLSEAIDSDKIVTSKKRKSAIIEFVPWHMEVTHGLRKPPSISITERNWALSTNRLVDKLEDEIETFNDCVSTARPRRRLKLTTQLMQQILPSIPSTYISAKASTSYENVIYLVAKSVLGDACNLISSGVDSGSANKSSGNPIISKRETYSYFSRFVEEITGRSKKTEMESLRLEERDSVLDVRLQCEDLWKEAVMNRFVKFHGGYQSQGSRSSSVFETTPRKAYPQRQVTAHALPRDLPDVANCILL